MGESSDNQTVVGANIVGNGSNTVTLGNNGVQGVYAGQNGQATVFAGDVKTASGITLSETSAS